MESREEVGGTPTAIVPIKLSDIEISDMNVRKSGAEQDFDHLGESIRIVGLVQPVVVMKAEGSDKYELIVGQRRYMAYEKLGRKTIPAIVIEELSKNDALIRSLVENVHRVELNHADAAKAATLLYKRLGRDIKKVSKATGLSPYRVQQYVDIDELASEKTKHKLQKGTVTPKDVQRTLRAAKGNIEKADELLDMMEKYKLGVHQKNRLVAIGEAKPNASAKSIVEEALKPQRETSVIVPLPPKIQKALEAAAKDLRKSWEEVASDALENWLRGNGYLTAA